MLLIYTPTITNRLRYIVHLLLDELSGVHTELTTSPEEFICFQGTKVAYDHLNPTGGPVMKPAALLFSGSVTEQPVPAGRLNRLPLLFPAWDDRPLTTDGDFPFDLLSASFYLVSRYEEYLPFEADRHGRFHPSASLSVRLGFLESPVVNQWLDVFLSWLSCRYPGLRVHPPPYRFCPTIDIDHAYAYLHRPLWRTLGGTGRSLSRAKFGEIGERIRVLTGARSDPFDTYHLIREIHEAYGLNTRFFILRADYGGNDNNIPPDGAGMKRLVQNLASWSEPGIHPSLKSNRDAALLRAELEGLARVTGKPVTSSRQHFLKISFPDTYRQLLRVGITDDYSMGYASRPGFRAGIAHPFRFFDLLKDEVTPLTIHPVAVMDVTFRDYLRTGVQESEVRIKQIIDRVRSSRGELVTLWHNESLSGGGRWKGWFSLYPSLVAYAAEQT